MMEERLVAEQQHMAEERLVAEQQHMAEEWLVAEEQQVEGEQQHMGVVLDQLVTVILSFICTWCVETAVHVHCSQTHVHILEH